MGPSSLPGQGVVESWWGPVDEGMRVKAKGITSGGMWGPGSSPIGRWSKSGDFPIWLVLGEVRRKERRSSDQHAAMVCW